MNETTTPGTPPAFQPMLDAVRDMVEDGRDFVLFEHGTVVVVPDDVVDSESYARLRLRDDATLVSGSAMGDPFVRRLPGEVGYLVPSHDPSIFTLVPISEVAARASGVMIGLAARTAQEADIRGGRAVFIASRDERTRPSAGRS